MNAFEREQRRVKGQLCKARSKGTIDTLQTNDWLQTLVDFKGLCAYCLVQPFTLLEHFIPVEIAGTHIQNCVPACMSCNKKKDNLTGDNLIMKLGNETFTRIQEYLNSRFACDKLDPRLRESVYHEPIIGDPYLPYDSVAEHFCLSKVFLFSVLNDYSIKVHSLPFHVYALIKHEDFNRLRPQYDKFL